MSNARPNAEPNYWMGVACAEHTRAGRDGGFAQLGHGKHAPVRSLRRGDWIVYYSPRDRLDGGKTVQAFTTIGRVTSDAAYQVAQSEGFEPFRVDVDYVSNARPAPIKPLLDRLELTKGRGANWGIVMRGAKHRLTERDMHTIAAAMGTAIE